MHWRAGASRVPGPVREAQASIMGYREAASAESVVNSSRLNMRLKRLVSAIRSEMVVKPRRRKMGARR